MKRIARVVFYDHVEGTWDSDAELIEAALNRGETVLLTENGKIVSKLHLDPDREELCETRL